MRVWRFLLVVAISVPIGVWLAVTYTPICAWVSPAFIRVDPIGPADAVYVLTSNARNGELNPASVSRLSHGLELVRRRFAPVLVISELPGRKKRYVDAATRFLREHGFSGELVVLGRATNTRQEAVEVAKAAREHGWKRILLVTSPLHTRRASATFRRADVEVVSSPAGEVEFDDRLVRPADRLGAFGKLAYESLASVYYLLRGWL